VFVAIPLESFVSSSRTILGVIVVGALRFLAYLLRLIGNLGYYSGRFVINLYDMIIFPSIWLEGVLAGSNTNEHEVTEGHYYKGGGNSERAFDKERTGG
jgi:hypothetical protein